MDSKRFYGAKVVDLQPKPKDIPIESDESDCSVESLFEDDNLDKDWENISNEDTEDDDYSSYDDEQPSTSTETTNKRRLNTSKPAVTFKTNRATPGITKKKITYRWSTAHTRLSENLVLPPFLGEREPATEIHAPITYFRRFFDDNLFEHITEQSNLYATQLNPNKMLGLTKDELEEFIGCSILMSIFNLPSARMFWSQATRVDRVADILSRNRWMEIKGHMHFNDNSKLDRTDKIYRIRPLVEHLQRKFLALPQDQTISVDEQMVPFKGKSSLKQYIPAKPYKWGYKLFVACGSNGLVHNFEIYTGNISPVPQFEDVGASGNVVLKLIQTLPNDKNFVIFFDNWFASMKLLIALDKAGYKSLGTVRVNRFPGVNFRSDKSFSRGMFEQKTTVVDNVNVQVVKWMDNRAVVIASTLQHGDTSVVKRWDRKTKEYIEVTCPQIVQMYNKYMGGVDLLDGLIAYYRIRIKSKKFYHRIFFHLIDMVIVNSWLLYRQDCNDFNVPKKSQLKLVDFKAQVGFSLTQSKKDLNRKRGRPSANNSVDEEFQKKSKKGKVTPIPQRDVRLDGYNHFPAIAEKKQRCKLPTCKSQSHVFCEKCKVHLCLVKNKNCFKTFHTS